jgi:signal transduction histidine kinase
MARIPGFFRSIQAKILIIPILMLLAFVLLINTYFLTSSRNITFSSKRSFLQSHGFMISSALSALDELSGDRVRQAMSLLEVNDVNAVIITDDKGETLYSSEDGDTEASESLYTAYVDQVQGGNDVFYSRFSDGAFLSCSFTPIMSRGTVAGVVYLFENDTEQGSVLLKMYETLLQFSIAITLVAIAAMTIVSYRIMRRVNTVLDGIKNVREGAYTYRVPISGSDEISTLGQEFNRLTDRLQKTEEIRRRFVADASHELKTPLASIRLLSDSILQNENMDSETVREFVDDIAHESSRLARITEKLLTLTRLDNAVISEHKRVDVGGVVNTALRMLRPLAQERNITLNSAIAPDSVIAATEDDLYQIVFNLAENAIKYNVDGGRVDITSQVTSDQVILSVADTGVGVPDEDLPHIFDRFYRVDKARSREAGGTGLGLSIVKDTAALHGGEITAEHGEPGGMIFRVVFPREL